MPASGWQPLPMPESPRTMQTIRARSAAREKQRRQAMTAQDVRESFAKANWNRDTLTLARQLLHLVVLRRKVLLDVLFREPFVPRCDIMAQIRNTRKPTSTTGCTRQVFGHVATPIGHDVDCAVMTSADTTGLTRRRCKGHHGTLQRNERGHDDNVSKVRRDLDGHSVRQRTSILLGNKIRCSFQRSVCMCVCVCLRCV